MTTIKTIRRVVFGPTQDEDIAQMMAENVAHIEANRARIPEPVPATKQLRANLERAALAYTDRERVLVAEIAARETELADVRRARDAATAALVELEVTSLPELAVTDEAPEITEDTRALAPEITEDTRALALSLAHKYGVPHRDQSTGHLIRHDEPFLTQEELAGIMRSTSVVTERLPHD